MSGVGDVFKSARQTHDQNRDDGADGADRHQTEAVVIVVVLLCDRRNTRADGHNEGNRHRSRGNAARIKGDGEEGGVDYVGDGGKREDHAVSYQNDEFKFDLKDDTHDRDHKEDAESRRNCVSAKVCEKLLTR